MCSRPGASSHQSNAKQPLVNNRHDPYNTGRPLLCNELIFDILRTLSSYLAQILSGALAWLRISELARKQRKTYLVADRRPENTR